MNTETLHWRGKDQGIVNYPFKFSIHKDDVIQAAPLSRGRRIFIRIVRDGRVIFRGTRKRAAANGTESLAAANS